MLGVSVGDVSVKEIIRILWLGIAALVMVACAGSSNLPDGEVVSSQTAPEQSEVVVSTDSESMPNIVFILVDDMGFNDVSYNGSEITTPNLDRIASNGVVLNRNYAYPVCSPTRAALMTGHNPLDYGIDAPVGDHTGLPLELKIMPEYFQELGYETKMIGKWHLGIGHVAYWPTSRGFEYHYGHLGGWIDFYTHVYSGGLDWQRNGVTVREEGHATDLLTADAIDQIESRDQTRPLFMYLNYNAPHSPLQYLPGSSERSEATDRGLYTEMMEHLDLSIGLVMQKLESENMMQNTLIVFSSDNGGDPQFGADNAPYRNGKGTMYEGGTRVPGLVWWPGHVEGGAVLDQQIVVHDWLPTLLDAIGARADLAVDPYGQSMWRAIAHGEAVERKDVTFGIANSVASFKWPYKLIRHAGGEVAGEFLYNLIADPLETNDLSEEMPELYAELAANIDALPKVESRRNPPGGVRPILQFRLPDDSGWDYDLRLEETKEPWAEAAARGNEVLEQFE